MFQRDFVFLLGLLSCANLDPATPSTQVAVSVASAHEAASKDPQAPCTPHWLHPYGLQKAHLLWL